MSPTGRSEPAPTGGGARNVAETVRLVVANRGEIARRVVRAAQRRGFLAAVVSTEADLGAPVRREADAVLEVPDFLDGPAVVAAAGGWGAALLHPGYGFLSEDADFAAAVNAAGLRFVGPSPEAMRRLGGKEEARRLAEEVGVPVLPAVTSERLAAASDPAALVEESGVGFPCAVKAAFGGGGIGIRVARGAADLPAALAGAAEQAGAAFGDATVYAERWIGRPRHVEIQVFGDGRGRGIHLGERECSIQRRRQKLVEWTPAFGMTPARRREMGEAALRLAAAAEYGGAGTVEFLVDEDGRFFFLEVNTRLQVEHPVTEAAYGVDLVDAQFDAALGHWPRSLPPPALPAEFEPREPAAAAVEARLLAESPAEGFAPSPGRIRRYHVPEGPGLRVDSGVEAGAPVPAGFDSLLAKVVAEGPDLPAAAGRLAAALRETVVHGIAVNASFLAAILEHPDFLAGRAHTGWVEDLAPELAASRWPSGVSALLRRDRVGEALGQAASGRRPGAGAAVFGRLSEGGDFPNTRPGRTPGEAVVSPPPASAGEDGIGALRVVATPLGGSRGTAVTVLGETVVVGARADSAADVEADAADSAAGGEVRAPVAGRLLRIRADAGAVVERGEVVAVVESMKMHWEVRAAQEGRLGDALAADGDPVAAGTLLQTIHDPSGEKPALVGTDVGTEVGTDAGSA